MTLSENPAKDIEAKVTFSQSGDKLMISAELTGCPEGEHGFHIHEKGECGDDGKAAGAHWDPTEVGTDDPAHLGNLAKIKCDADGKASWDMDSDAITLTGDADLNPVGLAMVVHGIDPANRVACGVIEAD